MGDAKRRKILGVGHSNKTQYQRPPNRKAISSGRMLDELNISSANRSEIKYLLSSSMMDDFPEIKVVVLYGLDSFDIMPLSAILADVPSISVEVLKVKHLLDPLKNALIIYIPDKSAIAQVNGFNIVFDIQPVTSKEWIEGVASRSIDIRDLPKDHPLRRAIFG
ncbi:hypothetical protein [Chamaesiphon sp.]|uniref:hypothetical protein n=1 Tax=Chamaesiphon sp. TaxID=2814140 RepID=UPI0035936472